jgi:hypothetical protein
VAAPKAIFSMISSRSIASFSALRTSHVVERRGVAEHRHRDRAARRHVVDLDVRVALQQRQRLQLDQRDRSRHRP